VHAGPSGTRFSIGVAAHQSMTALDAVA